MDKKSEAPPYLNDPTYLEYQAIQGQIKSANLSGRQDIADALTPEMTRLAIEIGEKYKLPGIKNPEIHKPSPFTTPKPTLQ